MAQSTVRGGDAVARALAPAEAASRGGDGALRRLRADPRALAGVVLIGLLALVALLAPIIAPYDPFAQRLEVALLPPGPEHLLGSDELGRDVLSRVVFGARISIQVGAISVGIALLAGGALGLLAGYQGGQTDNVIGRLLDVVLAFPAIILALVITTVLGPGITNAMIAIGVLQTPSFARLLRGQVLSIKQREWVHAARALGARDLRIALLHVLPNAIAPVLIQASLSLAFAILTEASLSFLGLGAQPPAPSWGSMLNSGKGYMELAPWLALAPGAAIFLTVLGFNLLGDGLRDALDPRLR
jgi:peptide/nickel transport system permease protein